MKENPKVKRGSENITESVELTPVYWTVFVAAGIKVQTF